MKDFIYKYSNKIKSSCLVLIRDIRFIWDEYLILDKLRDVGKKAIDVIIMGSFLYYAIHFNNLISYGIAAELIMFYYKWFIDTTKGVLTKNGRTSK